MNTVTTNMKFTQTIQRDVDVATIEVILPVRYDDEDIPYDAPMRDSKVWRACIDIDEGRVWHWPQGKPLDMHMKVVDGGIYILRDSEGINIAERKDYVPHGIIPGEYGDYVELKIDETGKITNWPKKISLYGFEGFGDG